MTFARLPRSLVTTLRESSVGTDGSPPVLAFWFDDGVTEAYGPDAFLLRRDELTVSDRYFVREALYDDGSATALWNGPRDLAHERIHKLNRYAVILSGDDLLREFGKGTDVDDSIE